MSEIASSAPPGGLSLLDIVVEVLENGRVIQGPAYSLDAAARVLWTSAQQRGLKHDTNLNVATANFKPLVTIQPDGTIIYGQGYVPDPVARDFWTDMATRRGEYVPPG